MVLHPDLSVDSGSAETLSVAVLLEHCFFSALQDHMQRPTPIGPGAIRRRVLKHATNQDEHG